MTAPVRIGVGPLTVGLTISDPQTVLVTGDWSADDLVVIYILRKTTLGFSGDFLTLGGETMAADSGAGVFTTTTALDLAANTWSVSTGYWLSAATDGDISLRLEGTVGGYYMAYAMYWHHDDGFDLADIPASVDAEYSFSGTTTFDSTIEVAVTEPTGGFQHGLVIPIAFVGLQDPNGLMRQVPTDWVGHGAADWAGSSGIAGTKDLWHTSSFALSTGAETIQTRYYFDHGAAFCPGFGLIGPAFRAIEAAGSEQAGGLRLLKVSAGELPYQLHTRML